MSFPSSVSFEERAPKLPFLGLGISTEFGAQAMGGLDPLAFQRQHPELVRFLEVGGDLERGLDRDTRAWVTDGRATTYHFLDLNLEEREDLDAEWIAATTQLAGEIGAAWLCGDAGVWHAGARDRGHGTLMPPILEPDVAEAMGANVRLLRESSGMEVLPENPPAHAFVGRMHLLDFFAAATETGDSGMLLDVAHLAIYQELMGYAPLEALDRFPLQRVIEIHVAGGSHFSVDGRRFIDDDHTPNVLPATWQILEHLLPRTPNLRAIVFEGERNGIDEVLPAFERIHGLWSAQRELT